MRSRSGSANRTYFIVAMLGLLVSGVACADEATVAEPAITEQDRKHWAFKPLAEVDVPVVGDTSWPRGAIDEFVLTKLRAKGLETSPEADRATLLRRVTFDLTGLPPTPAEIDNFLADKEPGAYERVVDRLLATRAYAERWAQHWLDLARFAESDGFEYDSVRPEAWKYRDWVIEALGRDLPYDDFVKLQIAGDLIAPGDEFATVATGFALCGPDMTDINLLTERRHMVLNDMSATVGSVFLGLQMGCAECHDHKYDPVSQADFYRLRAFFEPALHFEPHPMGRVLHEKAEPETEYVAYFYERGDFRRPAAKVDPAVPRIASIEGASLTDASHPRIALAEWLASPDNFLARRVIVNRLWQQHFGQGIVRSSSDFGIMGEMPSHPELLEWLAQELDRQGGSLKGMHRLIVTSATYRQASRPADEANLARWEASAAVDPDNRLLWRANRKRLDGEALRDAMLAAGERLSPRTGGIGIMAPLPPELVVTLLKNQWKPTKDKEDHRRRSIYMFVRRNLRYPLFEVFDRPDTNVSCAVRPRSTIAPQALLLLNSEDSLTAATELAALVLSEVAEEEQVAEIYLRALGRAPTGDELARARDFVDERIASFAEQEPARGFVKRAAKIEGSDPERLAALSYLSLALFNASEFVYVD